MEKTIMYDDPYTRKHLSDLEYLYDSKRHAEFVSFLFNNLPFEGDKFIKQSIKTKISSYKSQDKKSKKYDEDQFITYDQLIEKLNNCKLVCYYCATTTLLVYKSKKETKQWSLERLNNNLGHYASNTCISCLKCNLERRNSNYEYFKFSKTLCVQKLE
jgi:hypothetical protein